MQLSRRTIADHLSYIEKKFEDDILEKEIKQYPNLLTYLEDLNKLDKYGFFTGALLREIDYTASQVRFTKIRIEFESVIKSMIKHMIDFIDSLPDAPDHLWRKSNPTHTYRFLLAKNPYKYKHKIYVNRARMAYEDNVDRLYVLGSNNDTRFVKKVIDNINSKTDYKLSEVYDLNRDFRKKRNGIGALFVR